MKILNKIRFLLGSIKQNYEKDFLEMLKKSLKKVPISKLTVKHIRSKSLGTQQETKENIEKKAKQKKAYMLMANLFKRKYGLREHELLEKMET